MIFFLLSLEESLFLFNARTAWSTLWELLSHPIFYIHLNAQIAHKPAACELIFEAFVNGENRMRDISQKGHFPNVTFPKCDTSPIEELSLLGKCPFGEMSHSIFSLCSLWKKRYKLFFNQVPSPWDISDVGQRQFAIMVVFWSYTFLNDRLRKTLRKSSYIGKILLKNFEIS